MNGSDAGIELFQLENCKQNPLLNAYIANDWARDSSQIE